MTAFSEFPLFSRLSYLLSICMCSTPSLSPEKKAQNVIALDFFPVRFYFYMERIARFVFCIPNQSENSRRLPILLTQSIQPIFHTEKGNNTGIWFDKFSFRLPFKFQFMTSHFNIYVGSVREWVARWDVCFSDSVKANQHGKKAPFKWADCFSVLLVFPTQTLAYMAFCHNHNSLSTYPLTTTRAWMFHVEWV